MVEYRPVSAPKLLDTGGEIGVNGGLSAFCECFEREEYVREDG